MDHRGSRGVGNVLEWGLVPVGLKVLVHKVVADVKLPIALHVALRVHRDPVHGASPGADRLEAVSVGGNPVRPVPAGTPTQGAHTVRIRDALGNQVVNAGHDVVEAECEVIADDIGAMGVTVVAGATVVRLQHSIASASVDLRTCRSAGAVEG